MKILLTILLVLAAASSTFAFWGFGTENVATQESMEASQRKGATP